MSLLTHLRRPRAVGANSLAAAAVVLAVVLAVETMGQTAQSLPNGLMMTDGNGLTPLPFSVTIPQTWQFHYDAAQFVNQGPILITDLAFRAGTSVATINPFSIGGLDIRFATASTNYVLGAHSTIFAANILNSTQVFSGTYSRATPTLPVGGSTTAPWIPVGLQTAFPYDPSSGDDFIIEMRSCGPALAWSQSIDLHAGSTGLVGGNRYGHLTNCTSLTSTFGISESVPVVRIAYIIPQQLDLKVDAVTAPVDTPTSCGQLSTAETVSFRVLNVGLATIPAGAPVTASYAIDGGAPVMETLAMPTNLAFGQTAQLSFVTPADLSAVGLRNVAVTATVAGDLDAGNDSAMTTVRSGSLSLVTMYPWSENFDTFTAAVNLTVPPPSWEQPTTDSTGLQSDWFFRSTSTGGSGPLTDRSGVGLFAQIDDLVGNLADVSLITPCFDLTALNNPALTFWIFSDNTQGGAVSTQNFLHVDVLVYPGPTVITDVIPPIGHIGPMWTRQLVALSTWTNQTVQVRVRGSSDAGTSHALSIDDFDLFDYTPGSGQAPQPGLAVFDLNLATESGGFHVSGSFPGPYSTNVSLAESFKFHFEGTPNQPLLLFGGALNVGATSVMGVGQVDVGGPLDPVSGLPTQLFVVANGFSSAFPDFFFRIGPTGTTVIDIGTVPLPLGVLTTFQAAVANGTASVVSLSNAIEITIVP